MLEMDHEQGHAWHTLGQMEEEQGQIQAAQDCYQRGSHSSGDLTHLVKLCAKMKLLYDHLSELLQRFSDAHRTIFFSQA